MTATTTLQRRAETWWAAAATAMVLAVAGCADVGDTLRADIGAVPVISVNPTVLEIDVTTGEIEAGVVIVTNVGRDTLHVDGVTGGAAGFAVELFPAQIAPGGEADILFSVDPADVVDSVAYFDIESDAANGVVEVTVTAIGDGGTTVTFAQDILPIFEASCIKSGCHAQTNPAAGLYLGSYTLALARVTPGQPSQSLLYLKLQPTGTMPADGGPIPSAQRELIRQWIEDGAPE